MADRAQRIEAAAVAYMREVGNTFAGAQFVGDHPLMMAGDALRDALDEPTEPRRPVDEIAAEIIDGLAGYTDPPDKDMFLFDIEDLRTEIAAALRAYGGE